MRTTATWACFLIGLGASIGLAAEPRNPAPAGGSVGAPTGQLRAPAEDPAPIPGLTDKLGLDQKRPSDLLGELFESQTGGIAFRPPAGCTEVRKGEEDHIVDLSNPDKRWLLKVTRARLAQPMPLQTVKDRAGDRMGLLDYTVADILKEHPKAEVLRQEIFNHGEYGMGVAVLRYGLGSDRYLRQQAIFQATEQLYFVFNLTTPASKEGKAEDNPEERLAAESFKAMLETIQLLDRRWIRTDQDNRLFRTRALFLDWKDKDYRRFKEAIVPEQWWRIIRNGKDVGYTYVVEEFVEGRDIKNNPSRAFDGVLVSMRSRTTDGTTQVDIGSQMFSSLDRMHEDWAHIVNAVMDRGKPTEDKKQTMEFGTSELKIRHVLDRDAVRDPRFDPKRETDPNLQDPKNPPLKNMESYSLRVERVTQGLNNNNQPETHIPSAWYLPEAVGSMLPRLLPLNRPVTYLFQSYISDQHAVILRYVDVGFERQVQLGGQTVRAIPISDRIRLEGIPTVHYMSPQGKYLGSVNEESKIVILPTDRATLEKIWGNPDLRKPEEIQRPQVGANLGSPEGVSTSPATSGRVR
jgi:hypothetical protein